MKTESRILADTRIQKLEPFLNGYRGFLQLRCGKQRAFTFCATRDIPEDGSTYEHVSVGLVSSNTKTPTWEEMCGTNDAAEEDRGNIPIVAHRKNRLGWLVTMRAEDWFTIYREWEAGMDLKRRAEE